MADIEMVIKIPEEEYIDIKNTINSLIENGVERSSMSKICLAILDGTPLSELKNRWKTAYEQMCQEKIHELNEQKNELENQLNISIQNNIVNDMIMCCREK